MVAMKDVIIRLEEQIYDRLVEVANINGSTVEAAISVAINDLFYKLSKEKFDDYFGT